MVIYCDVTCLHIHKPKRIKVLLNSANPHFSKEPLFEHGGLIGQRVIYGNHALLKLGRMRHFAVCKPPFEFKLVKFLACYLTRLILRSSF
jgi:hypothetical protein